MDPNIPSKGFFTNVRYMFDLRDVVVDVQGQCREVVSWRRGLCQCPVMLEQHMAHKCMLLGLLSVQPFDQHCMAPCLAMQMALAHSTMRSRTWWLCICICADVLEEHLQATAETARQL